MRRSPGNGPGERRMHEPVFATNGNYEIFCTTDGDPASRPLLLINGFTRQCAGFPQGLVDGFVAAGCYVIRFDNRDVGLSTKSAPGTAYELGDMARDGIAVLDAVGVGRAHIWGMSLGGMIGQTLVLDHPQRALSLTSVMSSTGSASVGRSTPEALQVLMTPAPEERAACIEHRVATSKVICGPHFDEAFERQRAALEYDRFHPAGAAMQMAAIQRSVDRTEALAAVDAATTVIHGRVDPLITLSGGEATAAAIPGARLVVLDEMGHDLPEPYWPVFVAEALALADRAGAAERSQ
jgi:pimeloyl-ACP methyl ester carboxylesterase